MYFAHENIHSNAEQISDICPKKPNKKMKKNRKNKTENRIMLLQIDSMVLWEFFFRRKVRLDIHNEAHQSHESCSFLIVYP